MRLCSPTDKVSRSLVSKCCVADESNGGIIERGGGNAVHGGLLHLRIFSRVLDGVLHLKGSVTLPVGGMIGLKAGTCTYQA